MFLLLVAASCWNMSRCTKIHAIFFYSQAGTFLKSQLIFAGKTSRCLPKPSLLNEAERASVAKANLHLSHTHNHWANDASTAEWFDAVLLPYVEAERRKENEALVSAGNPPFHPDQQMFLLLVDLFSCWTQEYFKFKCSENFILIVYVPPEQTGKLQPLVRTLILSFSFGFSLV